VRLVLLHLVLLLQRLLVLLLLHLRPAGVCADL
jgi:hypothetical protein